ncbi:MAG: TOMM precursor leader peptide-binding protein [Sciscionella sp.]
MLYRGDGAAQVGTAPRHAVVLDGLSEPLVRALHELDGRHCYDELLDRVPAGDRAALAELLAELMLAGLPEDAAGNGDPSASPMQARVAADTTSWTLRTGQPRERVGQARERSAVVVHGDGRLGVAIASLLAAAGVGWVHVAASGLVTAEQSGCGYPDEDVGRPRRDAAAAASRRASSSVRTAALSPGRLPDLAVLADAAVPCPRLVSTLTAAEVPHLVVRVREGTGWVGPLVVPGRTSCLRCLDLHRTDRDPCWPTVAAQLAARAQPADLTCAQATAAFAVGQSLRILAGETSETWNATLELDPFSAEITRRSWLPHPECDCAAAGERAAP